MKPGLTCRTRRFQKGRENNSDLGEIWCKKTGAEQVVGGTRCQLVRVKFQFVIRVFFCMVSLQLASKMRIP
jgi:hypothetical protein